MRSRTGTHLLLASIFAAVAFGFWAADGPGLGQGLHGANFAVFCQVSHVSHDDPIVYPGQRGRSHSHTFFGNQSTNAFSTLSTLRAARTSCYLKGDTSAYWVPTLFVRGRPVQPTSVAAYYRLPNYGDLRPFPRGLRMIAGDAHARRPQSLRVTGWDCGVSVAGGVRPTSSVPTCRGTRVSQLLHLHVHFPDCWDGRRLDSPDHKSHMAYSRSYRCPASHPVKVPKLELILGYPIAGGPDVELASGGQTSAHGDFINSCDQRTLARLVRACAARSPRCISPLRPG